jgi:23S rRNA pseudouridine1911/1915/1917 synthase
MKEGRLESIIIEDEESFLRLDQILAKRFEGHYSRTYFQRLIDQHLVLLNGEPVKKRIKPKAGDEVEIEFAIEPELHLTPEPIPLDILFEDSDLLVINKPAGMVVHPAPGNWSGTFVNALVYHCQGLLEQEGLRPGIVHRLDKDTSGILVAAKNGEAQRRLIESFAQRKVEKGYLAIVIGNPGKKAIDAPIGRSLKNRQKMAIVPSGKEALSFVEPIKSGKELSLVRIFPKTGRTHQIRVHLSSLGTPVLGDDLYGSPHTNRRYGANRQLLHAESLQFPHPSTGNRIELKAALPEDFNHFLDRI